VDETDPGFAWGGTHGSFYSRGLGFRDHLYWTWNNDVKRFNWGKWSPNIPTAGNWEVQAYVADRYFGTTQATYEIMHSGMRDRRTVNQAGYRNQWVSLGTYRFSGGGDEYVLLSDMTGEPYGTRYVGFDAVRFVSSGGGERPGLKPQPRSQPKPQFYCCYIMPVLGFGRVWNSYPAVRNGLRCPTEPEKGTWLAEKQTKDGLEFLRQDIGQALVLKNNGTWQSYADGWAGLQPAFGPPAAPPQGMHKPGGSWKGWPHQAAMGGRGWPAMGPRFAQATVQQFEGGSMLWSSTRGIYVLYANGRWSRYD